jgi:prepilin-type N-terminal cleavage/methylation domain-containing protein
MTTRNYALTLTQAFTLIELLIVVAIIAILALIAVPNFLEAQTRAKVARLKADMRSMATAIEAYAVDYSFYPLNGVLNQNGTLQNPHVTPAGAPEHKFLYEGITTPVAYLSQIFDDPFVGEGQGNPPEWKPFYPRYFYTNLDWFAQVMSPSPPPVIRDMRERYGIWILTGAGPDRDRRDLARHVFYDPTNGTVSDGDVLRSQAIYGL